MGNPEIEVFFPAFIAEKDNLKLTCTHALEQIPIDKKLAAGSPCTYLVRFCYTFCCRMAVRTPDLLTQEATQAEQCTIGCSTVVVSVLKGCNDSAKVRYYMMKYHISSSV